MRREQMTAIVNEELDHIPRGAKAQNMLRMVFNTTRRNGLGGKPEVPRTALGVLEYSLAFVRGQFPGAQLDYDASFFANR